MKIPRSILVLGDKYKIKEKKKVFLNGNQVAGLCCFYSKTIYVDSTLPKDEKFRVFLHELAHAAYAAIGCDQVLNSNENEIMAQSIATFIHQTIKQVL